jgi:hypothetical protein
MSTHYNSNIISHKRSLGNDFVSGGFSIARNEITTITEPRYTQRVSIHTMGSSGQTILLTPDVVFTTSTTAPYNIIGASIQAENSGLFDSSMTGTWTGLEVDGRFRENTGSKASFSMDVVEEPVSEWIIDFELDGTITAAGLSIAQQGQLDVLLQDLLVLGEGLGADFTLGIYNSPTGSTAGLSMKEAIHTGSLVGGWTTIDQNPFTSIVLNATTTNSFTLASANEGRIINGQFIAQVFSHAFNNVYGSEISSVVGTKLIVRETTGIPGTGNTHPILNIDLSGYRVDNITGVISQVASGTALGGTENMLFPKSVAPNAVTGLDVGFGPSNYVIDESSLIITNGGSGYDVSLIQPSFLWETLSHNLYGKVSLTKQPDVTLLDIEHMTVSGKSGLLDGQGHVDLSRFHPDRVYRGGDFIFTIPTETDIYGSVVFLKPQSDMTSIDLKYFINPVLYPEYEHGLLQQLASDMALHPYGNRYTANWTRTEQQLTTAHLDQTDVGNDRVFTMLHNFESGPMGGWTADDVGKVIRETNGSGEAVIISLDDDNVRTSAFIDLTLTAGVLSVTTSPSHILGFGYDDGSGAYSINVTSSDPTDTPAKLIVNITNGSIDGTNAPTIDPLYPGLFNSATTIADLTIHYEEISSHPFGYLYPADPSASPAFSATYLKDTIDTAIVNISRAFTTTTKLSNLLNPYNNALPLFNVVTSSSGNWFKPGEWGVFIGDDRIETQPYHLIYPNDLNNPGHALPTAEALYQQNHYDVSHAISTIGSTFIVESEKGTDLLSSLADIVPGKSLLPGNLGHPHAISNIRKPQKWRIKFQYNDKDASLSVYVATAYQIQDDKTITRMQGRDGVKGTSVRLPGELCEVSYDLNSYNNKSKEPFFNRRGKTSFDVENTYPLSYRLTCTDHGTALFIGDQAAIDQDDDYSWFVIQRHVNQVTGAIELEDGKSPLHCVYSPSKTVTEFSEFGQNYYKTFLDLPNEHGPGRVVSTEGLSEETIYDITGKELKLDSKTIINLFTHLDSVVPDRYAHGVGFQNTAYHDGGLNPFSMELFNYANLQKAAVTDLSILPLTSKDGDISSVAGGTAGTLTTITPTDEHHGMQTNQLTSGLANAVYTPTVFDRWFQSAPLDPATVPLLGATAAAARLALSATDEFDYVQLDPSSNFMTMMVDKVGKVGFHWLPSNEYEKVMLVNLQVGYNSGVGPAYQGLWPNRVWAYFGDDSGANNGDALSPVHSFSDSDWDITTQIVPKDGVNTTLSNETLAFFQFDRNITTWHLTDDMQDIGEPLTSNSGNKGTRAWDSGIEVTLGSVWSSPSSGLYTFTFNCDGVKDVTVIESTLGDWTSGFVGMEKFVSDCNLKLESDSETLYYKFFYLLDPDTTAPQRNMKLYFTKAGGAFNSSAGSVQGFDSGLGLGWDSTTPNIVKDVPWTSLPNASGLVYGFASLNTTALVTFNLSTITWTSSSLAPPNLQGYVAFDTTVPPVTGLMDPIAWVKGVTQTFNFGVEYQWKGAGNKGIYVNPYGSYGDKTAPVKDIARLIVTVDGQELEMAPTTNMNYLVDGEIVFPEDYVYQGTSLNSYIYYNDKLYLRYEMPNNTIINLSYQNYSEDDISVQQSYMIKVSEDRDIPESWSNLHKFGKGIYRFVVREQDVLKPWDYHVSAILPQIDSPSIINPMEQLSITQDKTFVFNFPTPMASQRYIYPASEMDMICYSGADSSIQGGYTEVGQEGNDKYNEDKIQYSSVSDGSAAPGAEDELAYRSPYSWHLDGNAVDGYASILTATDAGTANKKSHVDRRIYVGTYSTRPNGSGMRVFVQINGGSIRPEYSDNIDRKSL